MHAALLPFLSDALCGKVEASVFGDGTVEELVRAIPGWT